MASKRVWGSSLTVFVEESKSGERTAESLAKKGKASQSPKNRDPRSLGLRARPHQASGEVRGASGALAAGKRKGWREVSGAGGPGVGEGAPALPLHATKATTAG